MSQRDRGKSVRFNSDSLKTALNWLLRSCQWTNATWRADCTWQSPKLLVVAALMWAWSDESTVKERFFAGRRIALHLFPQTQTVGKTYQGFIKLLQKWTDSLIAVVAAELHKRIVMTCGSCAEVAGFVLFAVDGSRAAVPRTQANELVFSPKATRDKTRPRKKKNKKRTRRRRKNTDSNTKKSETPAMWLTVLWHIGSGLPWDWRLGPTDSSERSHWMEMLDSITVPAMFVADAGFVGYEYAAAVIGAGHQLTIRVGSHVSLLRNLGCAREKANIVYLWPDKSAKRQGLPPLKFRLVESHNGKTPVYLITSVVDNKKLSDAQVLLIYKKRWGIELFYRHLKQTFGKRKLRSAAPAQAYVEMHWSLLGLCCMGAYSINKLKQGGHDPSRMSFAKVIRAFRRMLRDYIHPQLKGCTLDSLLRDAIKDDYKRGDKTSREYPRKKKEKPPGKPKITVATKEQRNFAQQIRTELRFTA